MRETTIAIIDDHPVVCEGLSRIIGDSVGFRIVGTAGTARDAVDLVLNTHPDLVILDLNIPGSGMTVIAELAQRAAGVRVVVLSMSECSDDVVGALRGGAAAYVLKGIGGAELCAILHLVADGGSYVAPQLAARLIAAPDLSPAAGQPEDARALSRREAEIYTLVRQGCCNKDIGRRLSLSEKTVKHYMTNMFRKLEVRNRTELAMHAPWN